MQSKYDSHIKANLDLIYSKVLEGATEREIYRAIGICADTWINYKKNYPELVETLNAARRESIEKVKCSLYRSAIGAKTVTMKNYHKFSDKDGDVQIEQEVITEQPPNPQAIAMYMRNYSPDWKDKDKHEYSFKERELAMRDRMDKFKMESDSWLASDEVKEI